MNYRKHIYRRLDMLVSKAEKLLKDGVELTPTFRAAKEESDRLLKQVEKIYSDARRDGKAVVGQEWSDIVHKAKALRTQSEKLLKDSVRDYLGPQDVNVHVLVGYCPQTIPYYEKMIAELKKTFPKAETRDIELGKVSKSNCVQGFTLISWFGKAEFWETGLDYPKFALQTGPRNSDWKDWYVSETCDYYF